MPSKATWSKLTVKLLRSWNSNIRGGRGFASEMRLLLNRLEGYDVRHEWHHHRPRFIPDAYVVGEREEEVWVVEIEETHPLTLQKLQKLINLYWWLDAHHWKLRVFTTNRYGQNISEISLFSYHHALESPDEHDPRIDRLTDHQAIELTSIPENETNAYIERCLAENAKRA